MIYPFWDLSWEIVMIILTCLEKPINNQFLPSMFTFLEIVKKTKWWNSRVTSFKYFVFVPLESTLWLSLSSGSVMLSELNYQTCKSEFKSHWVPHSFSLVPHLSKTLTPWIYSLLTKAWGLTQADSLFGLWVSDFSQLTQTLSFGALTAQFSSSSAYPLNLQHFPF